MELGEAKILTISCMDKDTVTEEANLKCNNESYVILRDMYRKFKLSKFKFEYYIDLYKPIDFEILKNV